MIYMKRAGGSLSIPQDILDAALKVERFFAMNGLDIWQFAGIERRDYTKRLSELQSKQKNCPHNWDWDDCPVCRH